MNDLLELEEKLKEMKGGALSFASEEEFLKLMPKCPKAMLDMNTYPMYYYQKNETIKITKEKPKDKLITKWADFSQILEDIKKLKKGIYKENDN